jgi:hypothetical protein
MFVYLGRSRVTTGSRAGVGTKTASASQPSLILKSGRSAPPPQQAPTAGCRRSGSGLSFDLIHPRPGPFTGDRGPPVRAGQGRWRPVVDGGAQSSKTCVCGDRNPARGLNFGLIHPVRGRSPAVTRPGCSRPRTAAAIGERRSAVLESVLVGPLTRHGADLPKKLTNTGFSGAAC